MDTNEDQELKVTFYPELFLQRRIWILNVLRRESITQVLDLGCGEGELLTVLCQPAPWLPAPPSSILPSPPSPSTSSTSGPEPESPTYNTTDDIPNLHISLLHGLDISASDLAFAIERTQPPPPEPEDTTGGGGYRTYSTGLQRWEDLQVKIWKGGLETVNEAFVGVECIVSMEVIEHLEPHILPAFAPMLLGVYHPLFLLITTPSYTYNARFTAPTASPSARKGFPDPTKRTDRIFRHHDHKFEWTHDEFLQWCNEAAKEWGYEVKVSTVGRAVEVDPWGREEELGGATSVAEFRRIDGGEEREHRGRAIISSLNLALGSTPEHALLATHTHTAHPASQHPLPLPVIAQRAKSKMEEYREAFMRMEELWFERDVSIACGGWIEMLVRAIEESPDLVLKKEGDDEGGDVVARRSRSRSNWVVELVGAADIVSRDLWAGAGADGNRNLDLDLDGVVPRDWTPGEGPHELPGGSSDEFEFEGESTGVEGDVSWGESEASDEEPGWGGQLGWRKFKLTRRGEGEEEEEEEGDVRDWGSVLGDWGSDGEQQSVGAIPLSASSSTAGWDGDDDGSDTDTTS